MAKRIIWVSATIVALIGVVAFITHNPRRAIQTHIWVVEDGDPRAGAEAIVEYGCSACHVISGIRRATGRVGPKLPEIQQQIYIGGVLPNTPENMVRWIQDPQEHCPATAMPDLGVTQLDARDIAAYLYEN
jgi:cytochrome c